MLRDLYNELYGTNEIKPKNCQDLTRRLSAVSPGSKAWSWRYIYSVLKGYENFSITDDVIKAARIVAGALDGTHPWQVAGREETLIVLNGIDRGSVVTGHTAFCPTCGVKFVPNPEWRIYCHICRPPRKR